MTTALRVLVIAATLVMAVMVPAAPAEAACVSGTRTFSGTVEGEDGRFVYAQIGIELFAGNQRVDADGCAHAGGGYHINTVVNSSLGAEGATDGKGLTKSWSVQVPSNVTRAFVEVYPKTAQSDPPGKTDKRRYGATMRHDTPIVTNLGLTLPLNCGLSGGGVAGGNGTLVGRVLRNGKAVTPDSVIVFSLGPNDAPKTLGWGVADVVAGGFQAEALAPNQHYQVFVTQGGSTRRALWIPMNRCARVEVDIDMNPAVPVTVEGATFHLSNRFGGAADNTFVFGFPGEQPVALDWDGNGLTDVGVRNGNVFSLLDSPNPNFPMKVFGYGRAGDELFIGDWDGNRTDTPAVRRKNVFHLRNDTNSGPAQVVLGFGRAGDEVFVGDWDGDGADSFAVRRGNVIYLRNDLRSGPATTVFGYGRAGDEMLVGDWDGDGTDTFAVRRGATYYLRNDTVSGPAHLTFNYGTADDTVLVGDWNADGVDTFAVHR